MNLRIQSLLTILTATILFAACGKKPDHARYIPSNAVTVIGIHSDEIGKKVAWSAITGSELYKKLEEKLKMDKDFKAMSEESGIKTNSTYYGYYVNTDGRKGDFFAILPLDNKGKWESFFKKENPEANITDKEGYQLATTNNGMSAGWNDEVVILSSTDKAEAFDKAFNITEVEPLTNNKHYTAIEKAGHDITIWVNYDQLMNSAMQDRTMQAVMGNLAMSATMWKDASAAIGIDFEDGSIEGVSYYYPSDELSGSMQKMWKQNIDASFVSRLPKDNLNMMMAIKVTPQGVVDMIEKLGLLGIANVQLANQDLTVEEVVESFTGDMVFAINDFRVVDTSYNMPTDNDGMATKTYQGPTAHYLYAMGIAKKETFSKYIDMGLQAGVIVQQAENTYTISDADSVCMIINDDMLVVSNSYTTATGFVAGTYKSMPFKKGKEVKGTNMYMFADLESITANIPDSIMSGKDQKAMISFKNLFKTAEINNSNYKNDHFEGNITVKLKNKDENSLLQIIDAFSSSIKSTE